MNNILVVGSINMDLISHLPKFPIPGETVLGGKFSLIPGGKGANQAVALSLLGNKVVMIGKIGKDVLGNLALEILNKVDVNTDYIEIDQKEHTGVAQILVDETGENLIVVSSGANFCVHPDDIHKYKRELRNFDAVVLQLELPIDTVVETVRIAHENHVTVIINPAPARRLPMEVYSLIDFFVPNESEVQELTGFPIDSDVNLEHAAKILLKWGVRNLVITLGKRGAAYMTQQQKEIHLVNAFEINAIDTIAAGDAFLGGFTTAFLEGNSIKNAIIWGNAAGALASLQRGAQSSLPNRSELLSFLKSRKALISS